MNPVPWNTKNRGKVRVVGLHLSVGSLYGVDPEARSAAAYERVLDIRNIPGYGARRDVVAGRCAHPPWRLEGAPFRFSLHRFPQLIDQSGYSPWRGRSSPPQDQSARESQNIRAWGLICGSSSRDPAGITTLSALPEVRGMAAPHWLQNWREKRWASGTL